MIKPVFISLLFVSLKLVFVASRQSCSQSYECDEGSCCYDQYCTTDSFQCGLKKRLESKSQQCTFDFQCSVGSCVNGRCKDGPRFCFTDSQCTNGCCVDLRCHLKTSWQCLDKNYCTTNADCNSNCCKNNRCQDTASECDTSCYNNWQCYSSCCKDNKCQETYSACSTTRSSSFTTLSPNKYCYSHSDCYTYYYSYRRRCCINQRCQACSTTSYYPWLIPTITTTTSYPDYPDYNNDYDYDNERSRSSSGGLGIGASIGIAVGVIFLIILKLALFASWRARRQQGVIIVRRRVTCVAVPIVQNDELQREHENARQRVPDHPPPSYSPRPLESNIPNPPIGPPPEYSATNENTNSVQTDQTQTGRENGNTEEINGTPQGSTIVPPPAYSVTNPNENSSAQTNQTQEAGNGNTDEMSVVAQGNTIIPPSVISPDLPTSGNTTGQNTDQTDRQNSDIIWQA